MLNETSYGLHRLTQRQGLIKEFDIILPKSWHVPSCEPGRQMTSVQRANPARPDVFIDAKVKQSFYFVLSTLKSLFYKYVVLLFRMQL